MDINADRKKIANYLKDLFKVDRKNLNVTLYYDEEKKSNVDILTCKDFPEKGVNIYSTLGLSECDLGFEDNGKKVYTEFLAAANQEFTFLPNVISTCAFNIINDGVYFYHDAILENVVSMYDPKTNLPHIFLVPPFLWKDKLENIETSDTIISFLMAIPISDKERIYAAKHDTQALEKLLEENKVNTFDYNRESVL